MDPNQDQQQPGVTPDPVGNQTPGVSQTPQEPQAPTAPAAPAPVTPEPTAPAPEPTTTPEPVSNPEPQAAPATEKPSQVNPVTSNEEVGSGDSTSGGGTPPTVPPTA